PTAAASASAGGNGRLVPTSKGRSLSPGGGARVSRSKAQLRSSSRRRAVFVISLIVLLAVAAFLVLTLLRAIPIVPQARAGVVERLGRYSRTINPGLTIVVPFVDRIRDMVDMREQVVSFDPQPVITEDNLVVSIDTVIYFQVTDPKAATYEIFDYI